MVCFNTWNSKKIIDITVQSEKQYLQFSVIGMYIVGEEPTGIFTRIGAFVTNDLQTLYLPMYK